MSPYATLFKAFRKRGLPEQPQEKLDKRQKLARSNPDLSEEAQGAICIHCREPFKNAYSLKRHMSSKHSPPSVFPCDEKGCHESFTRNDTLLRHERTQHGNGKEPCQACGARVRRDGMVEHLNTKICHSNRPSIVPARRGSWSAARDSQWDEVDVAKSPKSVSTGEMTEAESVSSGTKVGFDTTSCNSIVEGQSDSSQYTSNVQTADIGTPRHSNALQSSDTSRIDMSTSRSRYCRSSSETVKSATSCLVPEEMISKVSEQERPVIVPDSPRTIPFEITLDQIMLSCDSDIMELTDHLNGRMGSLELRGVKKVDAMAVRPSFSLFNWPNSAKRCHRMTVGSRCALCSTVLGAFPETVFQHAKMHFEQRAQPGFKCVHCGVLFAYEPDFRLHSSKLELWAFCRGQPDELDIAGNWLLEAFANDQQSFIDLLRQWEFLQLHWYLQAVHRLLQKPHRPPPEFRPCKREPDRQHRKWNMPSTIDASVAAMGPGWQHQKWNGPSSIHPSAAATEPDWQRRKWGGPGSVDTHAAATEPDRRRQDWDTIDSGSDYPTFDDLAATFSKQSLRNTHFEERRPLYTLVEEPLWLKSLARTNVEEPVSKHYLVGTHAEERPETRYRKPIVLQGAPCGSSINEPRMIRQAGDIYE